MRIFIASPLFNPPQHEIIGSLERILTETGYDYYSARQHSGSDKLTPEQKKTFDAWTPIYESNVDGLNACDAMVAVLEYAMPSAGTGQATYSDRLELRRYDQATPGLLPGDTIPGELLGLPSLPDAGTVWEIGYHIAQGKPVIGYYSRPDQEASHLNLMLSHGVHALVFGPEKLQRFLSKSEEGGGYPPPRVVDRANRRVQNDDVRLWFLTREWDAAKDWDAAAKDVE